MRLPWASSSYTRAPLDVEEVREARAPEAPSGWPAGRAVALAALALAAVAAAAAQRLGAARRPARPDDRLHQPKLEASVSVATGLAEGPRHRACGIIEDGIEYHTATIRGSTMSEVTTHEMCCAVCEADPNCGAWTWGKKRGVVGLSDVCFLKDLRGGEQIVKLQRPEVVSGMPLRGVQKHGIMAALRARQRKDGKPAQEHGVLPADLCSGTFAMAGYGGNLSVAALPGPEVGRVDVLEGGWLVPHLNGRAYLVESCPADASRPVQYASMSLLGKMLKYTTDVSGAGCGCNAVLRLVIPGKFDGDHESEGAAYRIDIQGGNQYAWSTQVHARGDVIGKSVGYGGGGVDWDGKRDWTGDQYGPGGSCIDTSKPFEVAISFPVDGLGILASVEVTLSQFGRHCPLTVRVDKYHYEGRDGLIELSKALSSGMTLAVSYEASDDFLWLDGVGTDGRGPCVQDVPDMCPASIRLYDFSIADAGAGGAPALSGAVGPPPSKLAEDSVNQAVHHVMAAMPRSAAAQRKGLIFVAEELDGRA